VRGHFGRDQPTLACPEAIRASFASRFARPSRTTYLVGSEAKCSGSPRCECDAHRAYHDFLVEDAAREEAAERGLPEGVRRVA
jgi:hypothetical protein